MHQGFLHITLCVDYELCVLGVSPGVVCTCQGMPRRKAQRRALPRYVLNYIAQLNLTDEPMRPETATSDHNRKNVFHDQEPGCGTEIR